jgi:hypothetical protein
MRAGTAPRRLLRHVGEGAGARFVGLDERLRAELAAWLRDEPDACPTAVRADIAAALAEHPRAEEAR